MRPIHGNLYSENVRFSKTCGAIPLHSPHGSKDLIFLLFDTSSDVSRHRTGPCCCCWWSSCKPSCTIYKHDSITTDFNPSSKYSPLDKVLGISIIGMYFLIGRVGRGQSLLPPLANLTLLLDVLDNFQLVECLRSLVVSWAAIASSNLTGEKRYNILIPPTSIATWPVVWVTY